MDAHHPYSGWTASITRQIAKVLFFDQDLVEEVRERERTYALYRSLSLKRAVRLERVHVHNLGYCPCPRQALPLSSREMRQACLFGSGVNACKARMGMVKREETPEAAKLPLSSIGLEQLKAFAEELKERECPPLDVEEFVRQA